MLWILNIPLCFFICYVSIRGFWGCKKRREFREKANRLLKENLRRYKYLKQIEFDKDVLRYFDETLWGFDKMYFSFWIWDFKKMIYNKEAFEEVEKFAEKSKKNVLPFKKKYIKNQEKQNVSSNEK